MLSDVPRLVRGIQEIYARTLDPADKPQGVGRNMTKRQLFVRDDLPQVLYT
jgi:hypothetical protein